MHVDPCPTAGFSFFSSPTPRTQHLSSLHGTIRVSEGRLALRLGWGSDRRLSYPGWGGQRWALELHRVTTAREILWHRCAFVVAATATEKLSLGFRCGDTGDEWEALVRACARRSAQRNMSKLCVCERASECQGKRKKERASSLFPTSFLPKQNFSLMFDIFFQSIPVPSQTCYPQLLPSSPAQLLSPLLCNPSVPPF